MGNKKEMHTLGITLGGLFAVTLLSLVLINVTLGLGSPIVVLLGSLYKGYAATFVGTLMGMIWGFIHGYVVGVIIVFVRKYLPFKI